MARLAGLTEQSRAKLRILLQNLNGNITPLAAARLLNVTPKNASLRLAKGIGSF